MLSRLAAGRFGGFPRIGSVQAFSGLKELKNGEVDVVGIPLLTTDSHPLGRITKVHGVVSASSVRNKNILIDAYIAIKGILGGHAVQYEDLVNECYVSSANGLAEAALSVGATHVVQVRFEKSVIITRFVIGTHCFVSAYGTAVTIEMDKGHDKS